MPYTKEQAKEEIKKLIDDFKANYQILNLQYLILNEV